MRWRLTEGSSEVTLTATTANIETEFMRIVVPDTYRFYVGQVSPMDLTLKQSGGTAATDSAEISVYVARPDGRDKKFLGRFWMREVKNANVYDTTKTFYLRLDQSLALPERWIMLFTCKDTAVMATAQTLMQLDIEKVQA